MNQFNTKGFHTYSIFIIPKITLSELEKQLEGLLLRSKQKKKRKLFVIIKILLDESSGFSREINDFFFNLISFDLIDINGRIMFLDEEYSVKIEVNSLDNIRSGESPSQMTKFKKKHIVRRKPEWHSQLLPSLEAIASEHLKFDVNNIFTCQSKTSVVQTVLILTKYFIEKESDHSLNFPNNKTDPSLNLYSVADSKNTITPEPCLLREIPKTFDFLFDQIEGKKRPLTFAHLQHFLKYLQKFFRAVNANRIFEFQLFIIGKKNLFLSQINSAYDFSKPDCIGLGNINLKKIASIIAIDGGFVPLVCEMDEYPKTLKDLLSKNKLEHDFRDFRKFVEDGMLTYWKMPLKYYVGKIFLLCQNYARERKMRPSARSKHLLSLDYTLAVQHIMKKSENFYNNQSFFLDFRIFFKLVFILQRLRVNLPVFISGESGSGMSFLIRFFSEIMFHGLVKLKTWNYEIEKSGEGMVDLKETQEKFNFFIQKADELPEGRELWVMVKGHRDSPQILFIEQVILNRRLLIGRSKDQASFLSQKLICLLAST